jgi:D-3-phosphoglycerate dehydrogenase
MENIDVSTARNLGIEVCTAPSGRAVAIAEHTLARLLRLADAFSDGQLAGKTLGLIGFGRIGRQVSRRALAFDMHVIVNQPRLTPQLALSAGVEATDLERLLRSSDFVSLHVPYGTETDAIIGAAELALMDPSACLINTGHTDLVDESALQVALAEKRIAGAALSSMPTQGETYSINRQLRRHPKVIVSRHVTSVIKDQDEESAIAVARQVATILRSSRTSESLSLELIPIENVRPHEQIDVKRVERLMSRLERDGRLVNPPVTKCWNERYIILDGATRFTALERLGYQYIIAQVVPAGQEGFELHTWYHAISSDEPFKNLILHLEEIDHLSLVPILSPRIQVAFSDTNALCYFLGRDGEAVLAQADPGADRLSVLNDLVKRYTAWGQVERTLLTDLPRLLAQFPWMTAAAIFPQFQPEVVFEVASQGRLLPAGLTRFVIPGRILRLNADLGRLRRDEPLKAKRAWFNRFLEDKLARSRLRFYQEPVVLLDE